MSINSSLCIIEGCGLAEANAQDPHPSSLPVNQALPNCVSIFLMGFSSHEEKHVQLLTHCLAFRNGGHRICPVNKQVNKIVSGRRMSHKGINIFGECPLALYEKANLE